ncbi:hydrolase 1, exosortase A system-associated [Janthinobacterium agaricidamnosum]|nr:hydrolase 1, exosortase A system-associated [Janthinobacterium agaricidamnosum]
MSLPMIIEQLLPPLREPVQAVEQRALSFLCQSCRLVGILSVPQQPRARGVLIVTGGPQYRVGSHRQFALLARELAARGIPVMRFDYRGMGDSQGEARDYRQIGDDIDSATQAFFSCVPQLRELVLWGLCDGATAAACHAYQDPRISGLILLNPWVRSEAGNARVTLRHYYLARLRQRDFWRKLLSGKWHAGQSLSAMRRLQLSSRADQQPDDSPAQRLYTGLRRFRGRTLVILSGADLGAREYSDLPNHQPLWRELHHNPLMRQVTVPYANHTFARRAWRDAVTGMCADWIGSW